jgi:hypothetical protein
MVVDQGWTTEETKGTFATSSWFEVSILRPQLLKGRLHRRGTVPSLVSAGRDHSSGHGNVESAFLAMFPEGSQRLVPRPSSDTEYLRQHCSEMVLITQDSKSAPLGVTNEGQHAWYLQGNEVARSASVFDGEMVRRYAVVWGNKSNPHWEGNDGSGLGEGFIESIDQNDWIVIWARAKVSIAEHWPLGDGASLWTNHDDRDVGGKTTYMAFA